MIDTDARLALSDLLKVHTDSDPFEVVDFGGALFEARRVLDTTREESAELVALRELFCVTNAPLVSRAGFEERRKRTREAVETARKALEGSMTVQEKTYNGWTNYETWAVKLWIDNEEPSYRYWREAARECWDESEDGGNPYIDKRENRAQSMLAERLKGELDSQADVEIHVNGRKVEASFYNDLMNAALGEVNWHEMAKSMLDDMQEEDS